MSPELLRALVDALLPGAAGLPSGTVAGVTLPEDAVSLLLGAGSADAFLAASDAERVALLQSAERAQPDAFRVVVTRLLCDYYESEAVMTTLHWPRRPPQPAGHDMPVVAEDEIAALLGRARARGPLWRS